MNTWSWLKRAIVRPSSPIEALCACLLFYNPLVSAAFTLAFGGSLGFVVNWTRSLAIADVVASQCLLGVVIVSAVEQAVRARFGRPPASHGLGWHFLLSATLLPIALPLGFVVGGIVSHAMSVPYTSPSLGSYRTGIGFGVLVAGGFFIHRARVEALDEMVGAKARIRELENKHLEAKLAALTAEMNPHLLFNALNTIAALIHTDPDRAEETVVKLADLYRGILRACGTSTHPLADELRLCDAYLHVEKARFGERLTVAIEVDAAVDAAVCVPVLIFQPFVENAVKHGLSQRARGGTVKLSVTVHDGTLSARIDDDGVGLGASTERGAGRAVANCEERLALAFGAAASVDLAAREGGGTRVTVRLPIDRRSITP